MKHLFYELVPVNINKSSGGSTGCNLLVSIDVRSLDGLVLIRLQGGVESFPQSVIWKHIRQGTQYRKLDV